MHRIYCKLRWGTSNGDIFTGTTEEPVIPVNATFTISLDEDIVYMNTSSVFHPGLNFTRLHAEVEQQLREDLGIRTLPFVPIAQSSIVILITSTITE
ncbi:MAG: hypothetical protein IPI00_06375 [Flavobacteriales bacterium]|nr:hypothetical protein [Flavobacteriales bacterium]